MVSVFLWQSLTSILSSSPSHSYIQEREELAEVDLRKLLELKPPDQGGNLEQQCSFQIVLSERYPILVPNAVVSVSLPYKCQPPIVATQNENEIFSSRTLSDQRNISLESPETSATAG